MARYFLPLTVRIVGARSKASTIFGAFEYTNAAGDRLTLPPTG
jgi:hypothetical protein